MLDLQKYLTAKEAATYLGVAYVTITSWRAKKKGPSYIKIGSKTLYKKEDLEKYIQERTVNPGEANADQ